MSQADASIDLSVQLGRLALKNPVLVASGTFGYIKEGQGFVDVECLGGLIPKTVTLSPRIGNPPPRTIETASGLLNSIGLDNDGLDYFIANHLPRLLELKTAVVVNIAGKTLDEWVLMASRLAPFTGIAAIELNISCPNVSGGVDFGTDPSMTRSVVEQVRKCCPFPVIAKLTPNVTDIVSIARAAADGGADAVSLVNTYQGMAIDWRRRKPRLGNVLGGLSGPAIKPLALRSVWLVARNVSVPIIGIGGISSIDDVMEFLVAGATAVQVGTASFYDPTISAKLIAALPAALIELGANRVADVVGTAHADGAACCNSSAQLPDPNAAIRAEGRAACGP